MNGKEKCNLLRQIRKEIAEANNIVYLSAECTYEGDCRGTCPKCDAEIKYLENELNEKAARGEKIQISGISMDNYINTFENKNENNDIIFKNTEDTLKSHTMGRMEPITSDENLLVTIEDLDLSIREYNCLKRAGIRTIADLVAQDRDEEGHFRTSDSKIIKRIKEKYIDGKKDDTGLTFKSFE